MADDAAAWSMVFDGPGRPFRRMAHRRPRPAAGEALVRVRLTTLCGSDLHTCSGRRAAPGPVVLGHEIIGDVEEVGPGGVVSLSGRPVLPGERVTWTIAASCGECFYCRHELPQKCERLVKYGHEPAAPGRELLGGLATHCRLVRGTGVLHLPPELPDEAAAPANCATATVAAALARAECLEGTAVLIHGAGLLGLTAAAMAADRGARPLVIDPDPSRRELAMAFGAAVAAPPGEEGRIGEWTAGRGADVALDVSGAPAALAAGVRALRIGGRAIWVGAVYPGEPLALAADEVVRRHLTIAGVHNYTPQDLVVAVDWLAESHRRYPFAALVARRYPLSQADVAFAAAVGERPVRMAVAPSM